MKRCGSRPIRLRSQGQRLCTFFSVPQAATTNGTYVLSRLSGAKMLSISMVRKLDRRGYSLHISEVMNDYPGEDTDRRRLYQQGY